MSSISQLAQILQALTYSEMMEIAQSLADICISQDGSDDAFDYTDSNDWARLLAAWSEARVEADREDEE